MHAWEGGCTRKRMGASERVCALESERERKREKRAGVRTEGRPKESVSRESV